MKNLNIYSAALFAAIAATATVNSANAAALIGTSGCTVMGIVRAGGIYDAQNVSFEGPFNPLNVDKNWSSAFGDGAIGLNCDAWNFQVDSAYYAFGGHDTYVTAPGTGDWTSNNGHIGGAAFWRDNDKAFGLDGSVIFQSAFADIEIPGGLVGTATDARNMVRLGGFAEAYLSNSVTFGVSAHYFTGEFAGNLVGKKHSEHGLELTALAKFYPTDNLAILFQADGAVGKAQGANDLTSFAATLEVEYKFGESPISGFIGARWAEQKINDPATDNIIVNDKQLFAGLKLEFGGSGQASLVKRDRTGTYDNTSTIFEKLPSWGAAADRAYVGSIAD